MSDNVLIAHIASGFISAIGYLVITIAKVLGRVLCSEMLQSYTDMTPKQNGY